MIHVTLADRRAVRLPWALLLASKAAEIRTKARGRRIAGQGMIGADAATVAHGFGAFDDAAFATYNLPQRWVERRQIPAAIDGRIPTQGATVLDLGCGPGTSTEVLCYFADPSWRIIGYDLTDRFVVRAEQRARQGDFRNRDGALIRPQFVCQSIAEPLRGEPRRGEPLREGAHDGEPSPPQGHLLADASVDFAMSGGVVGLYMCPADVEQLVAELRRVVRPGGFIALDAGPAVPARVLRRIVVGAGFVYTGSARSFWIEPRPKLVFERTTTPSFP